jgi:hypothetical protein
VMNNDRLIKMMGDTPAEKPSAKSRRTRTTRKKTPARKRL